MLTISTCSVQAFTPALSPIPRSTARMISKRWEEWSLKVQLDLRALPVNSRLKKYHDMRDAHAAVVLTLLSYGLEMRVVRRNDLDDPRLDPEDQKTVISNYLKRKGLM